MKPSLLTTLRYALVAGVAAAAINSLLFLIFRALGVFAPDVMIRPGQPLTILPVVISSLVPSLLAGLVFFLLQRFTRMPYRNFRVLSLVLLLLSFANPFLAIPDLPLGMGLAMNSMHVVVAGLLLFFFRMMVRTTGGVRATAVRG